jgi:hypothetical protein
MQSKRLNPRILYPPRLSFNIECRMKSFKDEKKLREFITTKPAMQEMVKGAIERRNRNARINTKMMTNKYLSIITLNVNALPELV